MAHRPNPSSACVYPWCGCARRTVSTLTPFGRRGFSFHPREERVRLKGEDGLTSRSILSLDLLVFDPHTVISVLDPQTLFTSDQTETFVPVSVARRAVRGI